MAWKPSRCQPTGTRWHCCTTSVVFSRLSSPPCCSGVTRRKKERQRHSSKIKQQNYQKITRRQQQELPHAQSTRQKYTRLSTLSFLLCLYFMSCGSRRIYCLVWRCFGSCCCCGSCVVSLQRRRQQHNFTNKEERGMTRRQRRKRGRVFLDNLWRDDVPSGFKSSFPPLRAGGGGGLTPELSWE